MKAIVTGGAGFIGSNLTDKLIEEGHEVIAIDNLVAGKKENINPQADFRELDLRDMEAIKPIFQGIDWIFHLAALPRVQPSIINPVKTNDYNVNTTLNVLVAARDAKVKKVVYSASSSAYGDQAKMPLTEDMPAQCLSPYALQKYIGELYCKLFSTLYELPTVSLRYFNIYGKHMPVEGDSPYRLVLGIFTEQRRRGEPMTIIGNGEQKRDFTSVDDAVRANIMAAKCEKVGKGEVINIGRGKNYSVNEIAAIIGGPVTNLPPRIEPRETLADNSRARELLDWEPLVDLEQWLSEYKKEIGI